MAGDRFSNSPESESAHCLGNLQKFRKFWAIMPINFLLTLSYQNDNSYGLENFNLPLFQQKISVRTIGVRTKISARTISQMSADFFRSIKNDQLGAKILGASGQLGAKFQNINISFYIFELFFHIFFSFSTINSFYYFCIFSLN